MTRRTITTLTAGLLAATIAATTLVTPAAAGGSISFNYTPTNAKDAQALQTGLQIYSIFSAMQNGASIRQYGHNNAAGIGQNGAGNLGVIYQKGSNHGATLQQNGNNNSYGIFQFGQGASSNVTQTGNGQTGATFQFGW